MINSHFFWRLIIVFCALAGLSAPAQARFLQTDPIGYEDQMNAYAYVYNDPINHQDPTGMDGYGAGIGYALGQAISGKSLDEQQKSITSFARGETTGALIGSAGGATFLGCSAGGCQAATAFALSRAPQITAGLEIGAGFVEGSVGVSAGAVYAQKTYGEAFSKAGQQVFQDTLGVAIHSIDDLASAISKGDVNPSAIQIQTITRGGQEYILNTRSAQALERAGVPRESWNAVNATGDAAAEARLTGQLDRNGINPGGCASPTSSGGGC